MLNKKNKTKKIVLKDLFGSAVSTRQAVEEISKELSKNSSKTVIDFKGIEFVSRSFAHEFLRFEDKNSVEVKNLYPDVKKMFQAVRKSRFSRTWDEEITDSSISLSDLSSHF